MAVDVRDNPAEDRYELRVDGDLAGLLTYEREHGRLALIHTEVDDAHQGQGLAARLVTAALDAARAADVQVRPYCPYVRSYLQQHPEQADLVADDDRARFGV